MQLSGMACDPPGVRFGEGFLSSAELKIVSPKELHLCYDIGDF